MRASLVASASSPATTFCSVLAKNNGDRMARYPTPDWDDIPRDYGKDDGNELEEDEGVPAEEEKPS